MKGVIRELKESAADLWILLFFFEAGRESASLPPPPPLSPTYKARNQAPPPLEMEVAATLCPRCVVGESEHT